MIFLYTLLALLISLIALIYIALRIEDRRNPKRTKNGKLGRKPGNARTNDSRTGKGTKGGRQEKVPRFYPGSREEGSEY